MSYVLFGVGKNESLYIREWVDYHLKLGFTHIYVYDNEDKPKYKYILKDFKNVYVLHLPGSSEEYSIQTIVISHFTKNYIKNFDYCMHLDLDEFFCLKKNKNISEFINNYFNEKVSAIGINWVFFGSNNQIKYENKSILERFTKCQRGSNQHIKLFVDVKKLKHYNGPHKVDCISNTFTKDTNGKIINNVFNENGPIDICQINHYKVKSSEEFRINNLRPRADKRKNDKDRFRNNFEIEFNRHDLNDIEDLHAHYFYKFN